MQDNNKQLAQFDRWGVERPSSSQHGYPEDIRAKLERAVAKSWHLEGNVLVADTQFGIMKQVIPTDYICVGMDEKNLPMFKKVAMNKDDTQPTEA